EAAEAVQVFLVAAGKLCLEPVAKGKFYFAEHRDVFLIAREVRRLAQGDEVARVDQRSPVVPEGAAAVLHANGGRNRAASIFEQIAGEHAVNAEQRSPAAHVGVADQTVDQLGAVHRAGAQLCRAERVVIHAAANAGRAGGGVAVGAAKAVQG